MSEFLGDHLFRIRKTSERLGLSIPTIRNGINSRKLTKCTSQTFDYKHCGFTINRQVHAPINMAEKYIIKGLIIF